MKKMLLAVFAATSVAFAAPAWAAPILGALEYTGNVVLPGGTGNSGTILSLNSQGNATMESGSVSPAGCTGDFQGACTSANQSTPTFASFGVNSAGEFRIYLDAVETDNSISLTSLVLNVYAATGTSDTALFTATYAGINPLVLTTCSGNGNNCVNGFALTTSSATALQSIFATNLRIGISGSFQDVSGGPERFFAAQYITPVTPVPEPVSLALLGSGLLGLGIVRKMRKQG